MILLIKTKKEWALMNRTNLCGQHKKAPMEKIFKQGTGFAIQAESVLFLTEYADDCRNKCNHQSAFLPRRMS